MKIYISADIEGVTGVVNWVQCGKPAGEHYDWPFARRMMTGDVNAAIRGARSAGATEIVVKDSHNNGRNLLIDELEPGVELISGSRAGDDGMMHGIDSSFAGCFLVGYHGMAGTTEGVMEHTISGNVHRAWVNGIPAGEMIYSLYAAGRHGVPLVFVSSDDKGVAEAQSLVPGLETTTTKFGLGRYMARLRHPSEVWPEIEESARRAVAGLEYATPVVCFEPAVAKLEFNRSEEADGASQMEGWHRLDAYTIECEFPTWHQAHIGIRRAISFAGIGS